MESCEFEMSVKRKNAIYLFTFHQNKRDAIGKADMLIRIFAKDLQRFDFILPIGSAYGECLRGIDVPCPLNGKAVSRPPAQQRECFIEHKVAGDAVFSVRTQRLPDSHGAAMMSIVAEVARQECPGVDENHFSSPYRYLSWLNARSSGVVPSKTALSKKAAKGIRQGHENAGSIE